MDVIRKLSYIFLIINKYEIRVAINYFFSKGLNAKQIKTK